jgi:preprotein translocase subunit SecB
MAKVPTKRLDKILRGTGKLNLRGIQLAQCASNIGELKPGKLPDSGSRTIQAQLMLHENGKEAAVVFQFKLEMTYEGEESKPPAVSIFASYVVNYEVVETFSNQQKLKEFLEKVAMLNVWPYWREFVQSMTTRMGLPPFPEPLIYMHELLKESKSKKDSKTNQG